MLDNRWKKRQRKRIPLRYGTDAPTKIAFTDDITREGLFIRTALAINPGTRLKVEMSPSEGTILLDAEVRWAKKIPPNMLHKLKGGMGLKIVAFHAGEEIYRQICETLYGREG
jgi:hypothetical protein